MKALVWTGERTVQVQERDLPDYDGKILIKVAYAGICGSDISVYLGKHPRAKAPLVMGHEFCGIVASIGKNVNTTLKIGDPVVVNPLYYCGQCRACLSGNHHVCRSLRLYGTDSDGGMAEYAAVPAQSVLKLPEDVSMKLAAIIEPVAVVIHGLRMIKKPFYGSAAVIGLGPMGLLTALMLRDAGVSRLWCVEVNQERAAYAQSLGLAVVNPCEEDAVQVINELTGNEGVDILVEASGSQPAAKMMTELAGVRAEILLLSVFKDPACVDLRAINFKEQSLIGCRVYTDLDFKDAIDYVSKNGENVGKVISHVKPLQDGQAVFQDIISGHTNMMKVLLEIG